MSRLVSSRTHRRYRREVKRFQRWADIDPGTAKISATDRLLAQWLTHCHDNNGSVHKGADCVSGVPYFYPHLRRRLPLARATMTNWRKRVKVTAYPPMPKDLAYVVAGQLARDGFPRMAVATLVAFHTYCRSGELLKATREDVVPRHYRKLDRANKHAGIFLKDTKTGKNQYVDVTDRRIAAALTYVRARTQRGKRIFPFRGALWRHHLKRAAALHSSAPFVLHSLRHGGALHDFVRGVELRRIQLKGRWRRHDTMLIYLQHGRGMRLAMSMRTGLRTLSKPMRMNPLRCIIAEAARRD